MERQTEREKLNSGHLNKNLWLFSTGQSGKASWRRQQQAERQGAKACRLENPGQVSDLAWTKGSSDTAGGHEARPVPLLSTSFR